jgi:threonine dehydrogenase-like Zn-dependent dehydrogenase
MGFALDDGGAAGFDVALHTSASDAGLQRCVDAVGVEGTVVELSWYGDRAVQVALGGSFHLERKRIVASQVGQVPAGRQRRWDYARRKDVVFALLRDAAFDALLRREVAFADAPALFAELRAGAAPLGCLLTYEPGPG